MNLAYKIQRGDIWLVDFSPIEGHEQEGRRPSVVMSSDAMSTEVIELAFVIPGTTKPRRDARGNTVPNHLQIDPTASNGLNSTTYFMAEQLKCASTNRFGERRVGSLSNKEMFELEDILIMLLDLGPK